MNYSKIEFLRLEKKVSKDDFSEAIGMSKSGYEKMLREKSCKVSTLESIAAYFSKPIIYFFDEPNPKVYQENSETNVIEEPRQKSIILDGKDLIIERQDKFIESLESTIRQLIEKIGNEMLTDQKIGHQKPHSPNIKGFRQMHDPHFKMILHNLLTELQPQ